MTVNTDRLPSQSMPSLLPRLRPRKRRFQSAYLGCGLLAALLIAQAAPPAQACNSTRFATTIETAPLVVRANVKAITELPGRRKQVALVESKTLVGIELGRQLTLKLDETDAEEFQPGSQYFIALADPHTPFDTGNRCGTIFSAKVVDGMVPAYRRGRGEVYTMAATEHDIRERRCQVAGHCPHLCSEPKRSGPLTRSQNSFYLGILAVGAYAALLLHRRRTQPTASSTPVDDLFSGACSRFLDLLSPTLHR